MATGYFLGRIGCAPAIAVILVFGACASRGPESAPTALGGVPPEVSALPMIPIRPDLGTPDDVAENVDYESDLPGFTGLLPIAVEVPQVKLAVPYYSQLDGGPWARANCGPATLSMALGRLGIERSPAELRPEVLDAQRLWGDSVGTRLEALALVAERHGATVIGMREQGRFKKWTPDAIRAQLEAGRPVIVQVFIRALPGRQDWPSATDHYLIVTGIVGDDFLYNDAMDGDAPGFARRISVSELQRAMTTGDRRYADAGFAVASPG